MGLDVGRLDLVSGFWTLGLDEGLDPGCSGISMSSPLEMVALDWNPSKIVKIDYN